VRSTRSSSTGPGGFAWLDQQQPQRRALALLPLVVAQCLDREGGQAQDGLAGGGLEGTDHQQLSTGAVGTRPAGGKLLVDAGQRLAEPHGASGKVEVVPSQAAQLAGARTRRRREDHEGAQPGPPVVVGGGKQDADLFRGERRRGAGGDGGRFGVGGGVGRQVVPLHGVAEGLVEAEVDLPDGAGTKSARLAVLAALLGQVVVQALHLQGWTAR
jgi:hypothetical protein